MAIRAKRVAELVLQGLEAEQRGIAIYEMALACVVNDELRKLWEGRLERTRRHAEVMMDLSRNLAVDPEKRTPGRAVAEHIGRGLLAAMTEAKENGDPEAAQVVACECVALTESDGLLHWQLLDALVASARGSMKKAIAAAVAEVEDAEPLYDPRSWTRKLWLEALVGPPSP